MPKSKNKGGAKAHRKRSQARTQRNKSQREKAQRELMELLQKAQEETLEARKTDGTDLVEDIDIGDSSDFELEIPDIPEDSEEK